MLRKSTILFIFLILTRSPPEPIRPKDKFQPQNKLNTLSKGTLMQILKVEIEKLARRLHRKIVS